MTCSPRIVGTHRPDCHSLGTILASPRFAGLRGEALVLALYHWLASPVDGVWHFWPVDERRAQPRLRRTTSDPIRLLTSYGWAICGQSAIILHALYTAAGLPARIISLPGHVVCEVRYDEAWHLLDADMWAWFRNRDGAIASAAELAADPQGLIVDNPARSSPCLVPDRSLAAYARIFADAAPTVVDGAVRPVFPHWAVRAHALDLHLRPGETVRLGQRAAGCFPCPEDWRQQVRDGHAEWCGQPQERHEPYRSYGNGTWRYAPMLGADSEDVAAGAWTRSGLTQTADGLAGPGTIAFRIQSPWVFAARPAIGEDGVAYGDGARLELRCRGRVRVTLALDPGDPECELAVIDDGGEQRIDLSAALTGRYDGIISFELADGAALEALAFEAPILCAPMALPRLEPGANHLALRRGDAHGRRSVPWTEVVDMRPGSDPSARWTAATNAAVGSWCDGWVQVAPRDPGRPVELVYRFDAPAGRRFSWFHALASVREGGADQPPRRAEVAWCRVGGEWAAIAAGELPRSGLGWDTSLEDDVVPDADAPAILLRIRSDTPITGLEFTGHLAVDQADTELEVRHRWREGEDQRELVVADPTAYVLTCHRAPSDHELTLVGRHRVAAERHVANATNQLQPTNDH